VTRTRRPRRDRQTCLRQNSVWLARSTEVCHAHGAARTTCTYVDTLAAPLFSSGEDVCRSVFGAKQLPFPPLLHTHRQQATPPVPIFDSRGEHIKFLQISVVYRYLCWDNRYAGAGLGEFVFIFVCCAAPAACGWHAPAPPIIAPMTPPPTRHLQTRRNLELVRVARPNAGALKCCGLRCRQLRHLAWHGASQCWRCIVTMEGAGGYPYR